MAFWIHFFECYSFYTSTKVRHWMWYVRNEWEIELRSWKQHRIFNIYQRWFWSLFRIRRAFFPVLQIFFHRIFNFYDKKKIRSWQRKQFSRDEKKKGIFCHFHNSHLLSKFNSSTNLCHSCQTHTPKNIAMILLLCRSIFRLLTHCVVYHLLL